MKHPIKNLVVLTILYFAVFALAPLSAQEWSAAQKEVLKAVELSWASWKEQNLEEFLSHLHPEFSGWSYSDDLPNSKDSEGKWAQFSFETEKLLIYEIKPVVIHVYNNVAIAHYYYSDVVKDTEGKQEARKGRLTDILIKDEGKWLFIGWHGGSTSKE